MSAGIQAPDKAANYPSNAGISPRTYTMQQNQCPVSKMFSQRIYLPSLAFCPLLTARTPTRSPLPSSTFLARRKARRVWEMRVDGCARLDPGADVWPKSGHFRTGIGAADRNGTRRVNEPAAIKSNAFVVVDDARAPGSVGPRARRPYPRPWNLRSARKTGDGLTRRR